MVYNIFNIKWADLNLLVQRGQLYWAFSLSKVSMNKTFKVLFDAECSYAEWHYAECRCAEWHYAEWHYAECRYAEWHYAFRRSTQVGSNLTRKYFIRVTNALAYSTAVFWAMNITYSKPLPPWLKFKSSGAPLLGRLLALRTNNSIRKDCFQNKSKFITEDQFTEHMNITTYY